MAIIIGKRPSNPNELPSQAWERVTSAQSEEGAQITPDEAADLRALWRHYARGNFVFMNSLAGTQQVREKEILAKMGGLPVSEGEKIEAAVAVATTGDIGMTILTITAIVGFCLSVAYLIPWPNEKRAAPSRKGKE